MGMWLEDINSTYPARPLMNPNRPERCGESYHDRSGNHGPSDGVFVGPEPESSGAGMEHHVPDRSAPGGHLGGGDDFFRSGVKPHEPVRVPPDLRSSPASETESGFEPDASTQPHRFPIQSPPLGSLYGLRVLRIRSGSRRDSTMSPEPCPCFDTRPPGPDRPIPDVRPPFSCTLDLAPSTYQTLLTPRSVPPVPRSAAG